MYLEFYNLKEKPFSLTPDPAFLYYSAVHRRALAFLKYGLQESKGFVQLTGPVGSGKTTLLRAILSQLDEKAKTAYVINPSAPFPDLLRSIMKDLEIPNIPPTRLKMELLDFFHDYLLAQAKRSYSVIVIIDEAQNLSLKNLEEIRMLSNLETTKQKLIQIVFVGQPELKQILDRPEMRQLKQRIQVRYHLSPLKGTEVKPYINYRLRAAGSDDGVVFTNDACKAIYEFSGGIPRLINSLCDVMLLVGYVSERKQLDRTVAQEAIREIDGSFSQETVDSDRKDASSSDAGISRHSIEPTNRNSTEHINDSLPGRSVHRNATAPFRSPPGQTQRRRPDSRGHFPPVRQADSTGKTVVEPKASTKTFDQKTRVAGPIKKQKSRSSIRDGITESGKQADACSEHVCDWVEPPQKSVTSFLHSFLRYGRTRKFHVTGSGINKFIEPKRGLRGTIGELRGMQITKRGENFPPVMERKPYEPSNGPSRDSIEEGFHSRRYNRDESAQEVELQGNATSCPSKRKMRGHPRRSVSEIIPKENQVTARARKARGLFRKFTHSTKRSTRRNIVVFFEDGRIVKGVTRNLNARVPGFYFSPLDGQDSAREEFVTFEQVIAVRTIEDFEDDWESSPEATNTQLRGQQILVTLVNGEVIEGSTLQKFDPACRRFFVVCTNGQEKVSWVLVERTGAAGILTENFREGIYAESFENLERANEISKGKIKPLCRHESTGDLYFLLDDFDSALSAYRKALTVEGYRKRLTLKISLSYFNRGIKYMKENRFHDSKKEFEKVNVDGFLREKAKMKMQSMDRLLKA